MTTEHQENLNTTPIDGIEILLNLARNGKVNPWDVNIVEVTDQYLSILGELKSTDLKLTGKTLLYAAILLRMKSDSLAGIDFLQLDPVEEFPEEFEPEAVSPLAFIGKTFQTLEQMIQRRMSVKQPRQRRVTLNDLIKELKKYEDMDRRRRLKDTMVKHEKRRMRNYENLSSDEIIELAHEEFIEDTVIRMKDILERFFMEGKPLSLKELEKQGQIDRVSAYIAVMFLVARGECDVEQEQFYADLYITPPEVIPATVTDLPTSVELEKAG